jgi:uncharacterized protein YggE
MKTLLTAAAFAALLAAGGAGAAAAQPAGAAAADTPFRATTLDVSGSGEVEARPDMAVINLGVATEAATADAALADNNRRMAAAMAALKAAGIPARDIQTAGLNLSPKYVYEANQPPRLAGYQASDDVRITVRELARLGPAVDAVVGAGANQVNGVSFGLADRAAAESAARERAVRAAEAKAQEYARALGLKVLRLVSMGEGEPAIAPRPLMMTAARRTLAEPTPIAAGELQVRVDVTAVYELTR